MSPVDLFSFCFVFQKTIAEEFDPVCFPRHKYVMCTYPGGDSAYEKGGDARRKFWIKPLMETDLGGTQTFFDP